MSTSQLEVLKHWLQFQNENTHRFLTSRKQEKLHQNIALQKSKVSKHKTPSLPTPICNDYRPQDAYSFMSPSPASTSHNRPGPKKAQPNRKKSTPLMHGNHQVKRRTHTSRLHNVHHTPPNSAFSQINNTTGRDNQGNNPVIASGQFTPVNSAHSPDHKHHRRTHRGRRNTKPRANYNNFENVINLSDRTLSEHELRILSKGLKFVPTPTNVNKTELITDIKQWGRRMRLREYFGNDDNSNTELDDDNTYKKPLNWTPSPSRDLALDCYLNGVKRAILQHAPHNAQRSNITRLEREAIKSLKRDSGIVIFQADKGAAVVVQNKRDYLTEAYKQLNGTDENGNKVYKHVASDPTSDFVIRVKEQIQ